MQLEEAIERCNELIKESHSCWIGLTNQDAIETVLQALDNSVPRKEVDKILEAVDKLFG